MSANSLIADSDRSIFEEFDERISENEVAQTVKTVPQRIAKLTAEGTDDLSLMKIFGLTLRELGDIRKLEDYEGFYENALADKVERPIEIDDTWDSIERKALRAASQGIEFMDADSALSMALRANRAVRRTKDVIKDDSNTINIKTVNIAVPHEMMEKLSQMNPSDEISRMIEANSQNKIVDIARPQRIEDMMKVRAQEEQEDFDIKKAFD